MNKKDRPSEEERVAENRLRFPRMAEWWDGAKKHGRIYSRTDVSRSGMSGTVLLWTILGDPPRLTPAWPDSHDPSGARSEACARALGFSYTRRAFRANGCGFNRAHDIAYRIAGLFHAMNDGSDLRAVPTMEQLNSPE